MGDDNQQDVTGAVTKAVEAAEEAVQRPEVQKLARLGFYTKGFLFVVIGGLALLLIFGIDGGKITDPAGALATIAQTRYGKIFLIVFIVGAAGHALWNILRGAADVDNAGRGWKGIVRRSIAVGIGLFYIGLSISALEIVLSSATDPNVSGQVEETFIAVLVSLPLGWLLLALIGLGVMIAGASECYNGLSGKFRENYLLWQISGYHLFLINILGILSFSARALLLAIMGYFFIRAAVFETQGSVGLDAALMTLLRSGYGRFLLLLAAVGLLGHGILAFYEARYRRIC